MNRFTSSAICLFVFCSPITTLAYTLSPHPRIFINADRLSALAERAQGVLAHEYRLIKAEADRALREGINRPRSRYHTPIDQLCLGITFLIERRMGHEAAPYAGAIIAFWNNGQILSLQGSGHFGYYALIYDWIFDAMSPEQRVRFGNALGPWLRWYTDRPEITLKNGHWWYNQTWGPAHLSTPNTRDGITPKLFVALALADAGTDYDRDAHRFLDSWATRIPAECIPAFDEMGGVWSESMGHGNYGPVAVIPWAFEAWRCASGNDLFQQCAPRSFLREMSQWALHLTVPFSGQTAWIDDNRANHLGGFARVAPILGARYGDPLANGISDESKRKGWHTIPWHRFLFYEPEIGSRTPAQENQPLARRFPGAGHVYMRSAWQDPDATWAFFGAGPKFAAHSRDDEGHFLIAKKGWLVLRAGGSGHNDRDYYAGGSLAFNVVTIYDPNEQFRRTSPKQRQLAQGGTKNENDGGLIRHVYSSHARAERGHIVGYHHDARFTYAAADLTQGYRPNKVREVTRQFLYLCGEREFFVIFDRIDATDPSFPKTWFVHVPSEPRISGLETTLIPNHVYRYRGGAATWLSDTAGERPVLSQGRARAFLRTVLPEDATLVKRGGAGHQFWGHPHEATAQYNHVGRDSLKPPIVPWRLEVEAPQRETRDYFLHVIEIGEENDDLMSKTERIRRDGQVGVYLEAINTRIQFAMQGQMSLSIQFADAPEERY